MMNLDIYVPPDERLSPKKLSEVIGYSIQGAVHFLLPEARALLDQDSSYQSFNEIRNLFSSNRSQKVEGRLAEKLQKIVPSALFKRIKHVSKGDPLKFPLPQIIAGGALTLYSLLLHPTLKNKMKIEPDKNSYLMLCLFLSFVLKMMNLHGRMMKNSGVKCLQELIQPKSAAWRFQLTYLKKNFKKRTI